MGDVGGLANDLIWILTLAALSVVMGAVAGLVWHSWNSAAPDLATSRNGAVWA